MWVISEETCDRQLTHLSTFPSLFLMTTMGAEIPNVVTIQKARLTWFFYQMFFCHKDEDQCRRP